MTPGAETPQTEKTEEKTYIKTQVDLTPLYKGEIPVLEKFIIAVTASENQDALWNEMLDKFGKYKQRDSVGGLVKQSYATVTRLIQVLAKHDLAQVYQEQLERLKREVGARFPILLLHDIGGTLIYRDNKKPVGPNGETNENFFRNKNKYVYVRPGASDYLKRLQSHPRVVFGFYSSIKKSNIEEILSNVQESGVDLGNYMVFDQDYCTNFSENAKLVSLAENNWDTYRDLNKVALSQVCKERKIKQHQICLVDNDMRKLQDCLRNCIHSPCYTDEDVLSLPTRDPQEIRDVQWHRQALQKLSDVIYDVLDNTDHIPAYLSSPQFPQEYRPECLIEETAGQEENKQDENKPANNVAVDDFDPTQYFKILPPNAKFMRFSTIPEEVVREFVTKGYDFYLDRDTGFKRDGKETYKFTSRKKTHLKDCMAILEQGGWKDQGGVYHRG